MKSIQEIGLKITPAQREYYRYTGVSAALERQGAGSSLAGLCWARRQERTSGASSQPAPSPNSEPVRNAGFQSDNL